MKDNKTLIAIIIFIILVSSLSIISPDTFKGLIGASLISPGFEVNSISATEYITPQTNLAGVWFLINTVFNSGGQSIVATITPDETKLKSSYKTKYPLTITVSPVKETVNIPIVNDGDVLGGIYEYRLSYIDGWITRPSYSACPYGANYYINGGFSNIGYSLKTRLWCVQKILIGTKGHLESPQKKWSADITLTTHGETATQRVTRISSEDPSVILSDKASATWVGSLVTGDEPPIVSNYVATFVNGQYWKIGYFESWDKVKTNYQITDAFFSQAQASGTVYDSPPCTVLSPCDSTGFPKSQPTLDNYISNAKSTTITLIDQNVAITSNSVVQNIYDKNAGKVVFTPNVRMTNQMVNFKVRADWVGVYFETGIPKIETISSNKFGSGETGSIILTVKNIGDGQGSFVPTLKNCPTFTQKYTSETSKKTVSVGSTETFVIDLSYNTINKNIGETCTVRVSDYNYPANYDEKSVYVEMTSSKFCTPNQYSYDGNIIYKCNSDGTARDIVKTCQYGVIPDGKGGWTCGADGDEGGIDKDKTTFEIILKNWLSSPLLILLIIILAIIVVTVRRKS